LRVRAYATADAGGWDEFVDASVNGTFLHTRRFLSYHGDRFEDRSALVESDGGDLLGVFPAAIDRADARLVVSHPGSTYGGIVTDGSLRGETMLEAMRSLRSHYAAAGFTRLQYKAVPFLYRKRPVADDLYALFRNQARRIRCDLSSTIDLQSRGRLTHGREQALQKVAKGAVEIVDGPDHLEPVWHLLKGNLAERHGVSPVHSLGELRRLQALFPQDIECIAGRVSGRVLAGVVLFWCGTAAHSQYIASNAEARPLCVLDAVIEACIRRARDRGLRWFDFGTSTEQAGTVLNSGLYDYKTSYGAGSTAYEFYELSLEDAS